MESNEGLKETRKPAQQKLGGVAKDGYGQRTEVIRRRPHQDEEEEGPRKRFNKWLNV